MSSTISAGTTAGTALAMAGDTSGSLVLQTNGTTTAVTIDTSQNVGIGTSSPTVKLQVIGTTISSNFYNGTGTASAGTFGADSAGTGASIVMYGSTGANPGAMILSAGSSERMRIDSSGNLLVGTTSSSFGQSGFIFLPNYTSAGNSGAAIQHINGSAGGSNYLSFIYNAGQIGNISQNGTTGVLYNLTSDYRLKNNPQSLTGAKDFVMALQPKKWQWWDGSGEGVGFIAHEFMEVAKYSGQGEKDAVDAEGKPLMQSIQPSSSEVMANLVAFIQEQQALIIQLQADVAALKGVK